MLPSGAKIDATDGKMTNICEKIFTKLRQDIIENEEKQLEFKKEKEDKIENELLNEGSKNLPLILNELAIQKEFKDSNSRREEAKTEHE